MFAAVGFFVVVSTVFALGLPAAVWVVNLSFFRGRSVASRTDQDDEFAEAKESGGPYQQTDAGPYTAPIAYAAHRPLAIGIPTPTVTKCLAFGMVATGLHAVIELIAVNYLFPAGKSFPPQQLFYLSWLHAGVVVGLGFLLGTVVLRFTLPAAFRHAVLTNVAMYVLFFAVAALCLAGSTVAGQQLTPDDSSL